MKVGKVVSEVAGAILLFVAIWAFSVLMACM